MTGLLPLLARRAATQRALLAVVLTVVVAAATLLGTCALLLTGLLGQGRSAALERAPEGQRTVDVVLSGVQQDPAGLVARGADVLAGALGPLATPPATWAQSGMLDLPDGGAGDGRQLGYLAAFDDLPQHAGLASGRWPAETGAGGPVEAVLPVAAAAALGLRTGDQVPLEPFGSQDPRTVVLVGTFEPALGDVAAWGRDALQGAGRAQAFALRGNPADAHPAYGPFVVLPQALFAAGIELDQIDLRAVVDLGAVPPDERSALRSRLADASGRAGTIVQTANGGISGGPYARLDTPVPLLLDQVDEQASVTSAAVLTVALVSAALATSTLGLAGRLVAGRREGERLLLTSRGAARRQLAALGLVESLLLAGVGGLLALLLSPAVVHLLGRTRLLADAGLGGATGRPTSLVATVVVVVLVMAVVLAAPALRAAATQRTGRQRRRGALIRSGADLVLAALAVAGWLELRDRQPAAQQGVDPVLVAVPVLVLLGGAVLALRLVPLAVRLAERAAGRSRRLVLPLVAWDVSRRPQATGVAFLVVLATAAATFAVASTGTWAASQADQATARVGTDLTVPASGRAPATQGVAVAGATGGQVHPVAVVPVGLGSVIRLDAGAVDAAVPQLLAVDTASAGPQLQSRLPDDTTWATQTQELVPAPTSGVPLAAGPATLTVTGTASAGVLQARPSLLVADAVGGRTTLTGAPVPLDGRPHSTALVDNTGAAAVGDGLQVVGSTLDLQVLDPAATDAQRALTSAVSVSARMAGRPSDTLPDWSTVYRTSETSRALPATATTVTPADDGAVVTTTVSVPLDALLVEDAQVIATGSPVAGASSPVLGAASATGPLPVLASARVARAADLGPGDVVPLQVRGATVQARVTGVVPYLPSLPQTPALLVDYGALADALATAGDTAPLTSAWWVSGVPDPAAAVAGLAAGGLPGGQTRAGLTASLRDGPLGVPQRVALLLLGCGAVVLALAGAAVHSAAAQGGRVVEVARLHALGVPRRALARVLLLQHGVVTALSVVIGAALGALASVQLAGRLVRSETGAAPVPVARVQWPWPAETAVVLGLLAGCALVAVPVTAALVRRAGAAQLRLDDAS